MKPEVLSMIKLALASDDTLTVGDREAILACCLNPTSVRDGGHGDDGEDLVLLTAGEVADRLHVNVRTVKRHIEDGKLPSVKCLGSRRVRLSDLRKFMDGMTGHGTENTGHHLPPAIHIRPFKKAS